LDRCRFLKVIVQFPISIAIGIVAIVIIGFGWVNSYSDPLISFLMFELFAFVIAFVKELQKVIKK